MQAIQKQGLAALERKMKPQRRARYASGGTPAVKTETNVPAAAEQAYADLIENAGTASRLPQEVYTHDREAKFTPLQKQGFTGIGGLTTSKASTQAAATAGTAATKAATAPAYKPKAFTQTAKPKQVAAPGGPQQVKTYGNAPVQVTGPAGPQQTNTQSFLQPGSAAAYMSPYMQQVVNAQKREAVRSDDVARGSRNARAVGAGAFGGSRQAIEEAEAERNLQTRLGDIQTTGSNAAFDQAQKQFDTEQALRLQSQTANQNAGLTTEQLRQQGKIANQTAGLQFGNQYLQAGQSNQQAGLTTEQLRQQSQIANQGADLKYGDQNLESQRLGEASRQFGANLGLQNLQTSIQGATAQGTIGSDLHKQQTQDAVAQVTAGAGQQEDMQKILDRQYEDFLNQQNYPYQQLGWMSDILRGTQGTSRTMYEQPAKPSNLQTLTGLATTLYGASTKAKGGVVGYDEGGEIGGGLASIPIDVGDYGDGGIVGYAKGSDDEGVKNEYEDYVDDPFADFPGGVATAAQVKKTAKRTRDLVDSAKSAANYGTDIQSVSRYAKPGMLSKVGSVVGKAAIPLTLGLAGLETYRMPRAQRNERLGLDPEKDYGTVGNAGVTGAVYGSNVLDSALFGIPGKLFYPDLQHDEPKKAAAAKEKKDGVIDTGEVVPAKTSGAGAGGGATAEGADSPETMIANRKKLGYDLGAVKEQGIASLKAVADARKADAEETLRETDELYAKQGIAGLEREKRLKGEIEDIETRRGQAKGDAIMQAGLAIMMAPPGSLAVALAHGAKVGLDTFRGSEKELRAEKQALDESMDKLTEFRRAESMAQGKERTQLTHAVRAAETDAKEKMGAFMQTIGMEEHVKAPEAMFTALQNGREAAKTRAAQVSVANARNAALSGGIGGLGGGKPMTAAQRAAAVNNLTDDIMKSREGMRLSVPQARAMAERMLNNQQQQPRSGWSSTVSATSDDED